MPNILVDDFDETLAELKDVAVTLYDGGVAAADAAAQVRAEDWLGGEDFTDGSEQRRRNEIDGASTR